MCSPPYLLHAADQLLVAGSLVDLEGGLLFALPLS